MGKGSSQTIGFHYLFDILFGLCRGPINELVAIKVGEKIAWTGSATDNSIKAIKKPGLFGGEKKEGGIQGPFRLFMGDQDQILPGAESIDCGPQKPYGGSRTLKAVKTQIGGRVSEMRGTTMLWFSGLIASMNPYPKEWAFRARRSDKGWHNDTPWYPTLARIILDGTARQPRTAPRNIFAELLGLTPIVEDTAITTPTIHAMNPSHIIFQCYTDPAWGRGLPWAFMDQNSFRYGANLFCDEGFGLCFRWQRKDDIDTFIATVQDHVDASTYLDPETGLITLKPWRNDYVVADLPLFTPSTGLLEITEDDSGSQDVTFNEVIGKGVDPITNEPFQLRVHNLAARHSQGAANPETKEYPGIPTKGLLVRVLQREVKKHASGLKKLYVTLDRRGWKIRPGMCFRIADPRREIEMMVLRAVEIDDTDKKGKIKIRAMQDVWGLPATSFVTPTEPTVQEPPTEALPPVISKLLEANYRDLRYRVASSSDLADYAGSGVIAMLALAPDPLMPQYELATRTTGEPEFENRGTGSFTGAALLVANIGPYDTEFVLQAETDISEDIVGQVVLLGEEQMGVVSYDADTSTMMVTRGVGDTVPTTHLANEVLWTLDDDAASDLRAYIPGETVEAAALTLGGGEMLDIADADIQSIEIVGRHNMPYPPGNVLVNGDPALELPDDFYTEPLLTWTHRDRILQEEQIVAHEEGSVGPEAGTTYNVRVYDMHTPDVVLRNVTGLTDPTWTYLEADQALDGEPEGVYMELESERDGLASFQHYRFFVPLTLLSGYGFDYGNNYGGAV